jgi:dipeptidase E
MLLTSAGLANDAIQTALADLVGRPFEETSVVVVITASLVVPGDKRWLIKDLVKLDELCFRQIDILDLAAVSPGSVETRLREADVVYVEGGDAYHLARTILDRNLVELFNELLADKVYVGVSAGSMIFTKHLDAPTAELFAEEDDPSGVEPPFGFFDWYLKPHLHSDFTPERTDEWAERIGQEVRFPVYFIDDDTAVQVRACDTSGGEPIISVVSEGRWRLLGQRA